MTRALKRRGGGASGAAQRTDNDRRRGNHERHQRDVEEFEEQFELLDILAQRRLHAAQFAARHDHVGAKLLDGAGLFRGQCGVGFGLFAAGQFAQFGLGLFELFCSSCSLAP